MYRSGNPALKENTFLDAASGTVVTRDGEVMTLNGTVHKTGLLLFLAVLTGAYAWNSIEITPDGLSPNAMLYLIGGVIALSMLLLLAAFPSVVIPLTAAAMNLLSVGAAYGVMAYVLEGGWAGQLLGVDTETPMPGFVPVPVFAVLFGLSMDYEVFLISRMREAWTRTGDNARAVRDGLAGTGRVITAAAAIMSANRVEILFTGPPQLWPGMPQSTSREKTSGRHPRANESGG